MFDFESVLRLTDQLHTILCLARDNEAARSALLDSARAILDSVAVAISPKRDPALELEDEE